MSDVASAERATQTATAGPSVFARDCPLCGAAAASGTPRSEGQLLTCGGCGLIYRVRAASDEERGYWSGYTANQIEQSYDQRRIPYYSIFWRRLSQLPRTVGAGRSVLDVGCVPGMVLKEAKAAGWDAHGAELSAELCEATTRYCGATMWEGHIESIDFKGRKFDLVVFSDVFRCVSKPNEALAKCREILKPGGALVIREIDADRPRHAGRLAKPYPYDMQFLTPRTMRRFLENAGFDRVQMLSSPMSLMTSRRLGRIVRSSEGVYRALLGAANAVISLAAPLGWVTGRPITPSFLGVGYKPKLMLRRKRTHVGRGRACHCHE